MKLKQQPDLNNVIFSDSVQPPSEKDSNRAMHIRQPIELDLAMQIKDLIRKIVLLILILFRVLILSNKLTRDRVLLTLNNAIDLIQSCTDGDGESSNK